MSTGEFYALIPRGSGSIKSTPSRVPKHGATYGEYQLMKKKRVSVPTLGKGYSAPMCIMVDDTTNMYDVIFKPKTWQCKAWNLIGSDLDLDTKPPFKNNRSLTMKMRHAIRIGVALKVRLDIPKVPTRYGGKPVIDQIAPKDNPYGIYRVATTEKEIISLFNTVYEMLFENTELYIASAKKLGYGKCVFIMKSMIIYDDKSYDCITGDARNLFYHLGLKFNEKGKVKL